MPWDLSAIAPWLNLSAGVVAFGAVFAFFSKLEALASPSAKRDIAAWLLRIDLPDAAPSWPRHFAYLFDRVFGKRHLTFKCFFRSCLASFVSLCLISLFLVSVSARFRANLHLDEPIKPLSIGIIGFLLALSFLPDYVSLLKSRWIISLFVRVNNIFVQELFILIDVLATMLIWLIFQTLWFGPLLLLKINPEFELTLTNILIMELFILDFEAMRGDSALWQAMLFASCFTVIWAELYVLAGWVARVIAVSRHGLRLFRWYFDVESHPVQSLGIVAAFITLVVVWAAGLAAFLK